jgi:hypothetical protein
VTEIDPKLGKQLDVDECIEQAMLEEEAQRDRDDGNPWPKRKTAWQQQQDENAQKPAMSAKDVVREKLNQRPKGAGR